MTSFTSLSHSPPCLYPASAAMYPMGFPMLILRPAMNLSHAALITSFLITTKEFLSAATLNVLDEAVNMMMRSSGSATDSVGVCTAPANVRS